MNILFVSIWIVFFSVKAKVWKIGWTSSYKAAETGGREVSGKHSIMLLLDIQNLVLVLKSVSIDSMIFFPFTIDSKLSYFQNNIQSWIPRNVCHESPEVRTIAFPGGIPISGLQSCSDRVRDPNICLLSCQWKSWLLVVHVLLLAFEEKFWYRPEKPFWQNVFRSRVCQW